MLTRCPRLDCISAMKSANTGFASRLESCQDPAYHLWRSDDCCVRSRQPSDDDSCIFHTGFFYGKQVLVCTLYSEPVSICALTLHWNSPQSMLSVAQWKTWQISCSQTLRDSHTYSDTICKRYEAMVYVCIYVDMRAQLFEGTWGFNSGSIGHRMAYMLAPLL